MTARRRGHVPIAIGARRLDEIRIRLTRADTAGTLSRRELGPCVLEAVDTDDTSPLHTTIILRFGRTSRS